MKFKPPEKMDTAALLTERADCVQVLRETDEDEDAEWYAAVLRRLPGRPDRSPPAAGLIRAGPAVAGSVQ